MADARNIVKIILLLLGEQAAKVRLEASRVFVGFLGGNLAAARLARTFSFSAVAIRVVHLRELAFTTGLPK